MLQKITEGFRGNFEFLIDYQSGTHKLDMKYLYYMYVCL